jgi:hypothetical protein
VWAVQLVWVAAGLGQVAAGPKPEWRGVEVAKLAQVLVWRVLVLVLVSAPG